MKKQFIEHLQKNYPDLGSEDLNGLISDNLLSPFFIELPKKILEQAQGFVKQAFALRSSENYLNSLASEVASRGLKDPGNKSILMSYDFHLDESENIKLIEINTNAAFLALGYELYKSRNFRLPVSDFDILEIKSNIEQELLLNQKKGSPQISILDEKPREQRLFIEFLVFQSLFKKWGWQSKIQDIAEPLESTNFVYNRYTDFYLESETSKVLREKFLNQEICFSPNPFEYLVLADKQRMIDWSNSNVDFKNHLPGTWDVTPQTAEEIWSRRKGLFLKPKRAFGSKQSYKGASISRKAFDALLTQDFIAQEYVAAPEKVFETPEGPQSFKFDLRFYAYQDRVQMVMARLYQGQVTNLRTTYGGFAPVLFS